MIRRLPWIDHVLLDRFLLMSLWMLAATDVTCCADDSPATSAAALPATKKIDFATDVAPILKRNCIDCHGAALQLGDLRLDQRKFVIEEGRDRDLVVAGRSADSLLIRRLVDKDLGLIMPPSFPFFPEDKPGLPESQIRILRQWIDEGAQWPEDASPAIDDQASRQSPAATELFAAIRGNDRSAVERLLADRTLANAVDRHGGTPLMQAALYADAGLMSLLIERGAKVDAADQAGATALMLSAGDLAKVRLLIQHGAKVDARSELGRTPLLIASTYAGNADVVRLLLKSGAKVTDRDKFGETVLTSASKRGDVELVEALIEAGADVNSGGGFVGRTPLAWAADEGHVTTIACLLKHGAGRDPKSLNSAFFNAIVRGSAESVELLLKAGADVNAPSGFAGYTPLMGAAYSETVSAPTVKLLLERGADVKARAATRETALQLAQKRGQTAVVELLRQAGAAE